MKKTYIQISILLAFAILFQQDALAWGKTGHRVIGQVAESYLSKKAKKELKKLLGNQNLAHVSNYMDEIKSNSSFDHTHTWHYANIDSGRTYENTAKHPDGDLISAIEEQRKILVSDKSTKEQKAQAVKFLVHLVGDIHQPFHAGHASDWGGNKIKVEWFWEPSNIHRVWDSGMIDSYQMSYTELASEIDFTTKQDVLRWQKSTTIEMLVESNNIAEKIYYNVPKKLNYKYMQDNFPVVKQRMLMAGVRLAGILNQAFQ